MGELGLTCAGASAVTMRVRRAGLSPSATSIMVLTATAVSTKVRTISENAQTLKFEQSGFETE